MTDPTPDVPTLREWPENAWPTPAELADWLFRCTSAERLNYAEKSIADAQRSARCFEQNHADRLEAAEVAVCDQEHGHEGNPARVYGHHGSRRTCIRIKATDQWIYDPAWEARHG